MESITILEEADGHPAHVHEIKNLQKLITPSGKFTDDTNSLRTDQAATQQSYQSASFQTLVNFTKLHPEPMLQISSEGIVLVQNDAAATLERFNCNGNWLDGTSFYKQIVGTLRTDSAPQLIQVNTQFQTYSFQCYYNSCDNTFYLNGREIANETNHEEALSFNIKNITNRISPLLENLKDGILIEDENRNLLLTNSSFCKTFGINGTPSSLIGIDCGKLTKKLVQLCKNPEASLSEINSLVISQQHTSNREIILADGRILQRDFIPIKNSEGTYMGSMWVFDDITASAKAKQAVEDQRRFYEIILNKLPADIAVFDTNFRYQYVNPVSLKNPELREWIIGKTDFEYFSYRRKSPEIANTRLGYFEQITQSKKEVRWEEKSFTAEGDERVHLRILYPVLDDAGNVQQVIGYGIEITEGKLIEQQVKINEKRYRDLINFSQGIIVTHDLNGVIKSINPAVEKVLGFHPDMVVGQNLKTFLPEEDREAFQQIYISNLEQDGSLEGVLRIYNKSGKRAYLLYKNVVVKEPGTEPYVIGFAQDITERIIAERELAVAKQASEEGSRAKERFLANMSHEIRTPMNGIIGIANLLQKTSLNSVQKNYLNLVLESANNLIVIINDILDLEKIIAGKLVFESIPFNVNEKIQIIAESFRYKAEEKDLSLVINNNLPDNLCVAGDPYRLSQILTNIISNAIKFTEFGQISITIDLEEIDENDVRITYCIADTGIGISPDKLVAIFDPYVQERSEISRKYGGTGLGLAISKNLVDMQGGVMEVKSILDNGSNFVITLPYKKTTGEAIPTQFTSEYNLLIGKKILVAEDVEINQFLVNHILTTWGCEVTIVSNGKEALLQVTNNDFDALLMDIQMPVMDGIESTQCIRKLPDTAKATIPIIALTANALKGDDVKYLDAGMNGYLTKPFKEEALYTILVQSLTLEQSSPKQQIKDVMSTATQISEEKEAPLYDLTFLKTMSGNDDSFLPMMAKLFVDTAPGVLQKMEEALNNKDWKTVGTLAHKLKPTIDTMNIASLIQIVRLTELHGRSEIELETLPEKATLIITTLRSCVESIKREFDL